MTRVSSMPDEEVTQEDLDHDAVVAAEEEEEESPEPNKGYAVGELQRTPE